MLLSINESLVNREIDKCYFSNEAFKAYFLNNSGYEIICKIAELGGIEEFDLLALSETNEQREALKSFVTKCIDNKILILK